jgi:hypothetical protein
MIFIQDNFSASFLPQRRNCDVRKDSDQSITRLSTYVKNLVIWLVADVTVMTLSKKADRKIIFDVIYHIPYYIKSYLFWYFIDDIDNI